MRIFATTVAGLLLACVLLTGGCSEDPTKGYTLKSQFPEDVRTVHVPIWHRGRNVYRRGLEMRLTEALIKRLELDTPYKVTDKDRAHTELTGTIDTISQRVMSFNPDSGLPREKEITLIVSFSWVDLRNGRDIVRRRNFRQAGTYIPPQPLSEDFFLGSEDVINRLAQRIVEQMAAEW